MDSSAPDLDGDQWIEASNGGLKRSEPKVLVGKNAIACGIVVDAEGNSDLGRL